MSSAPINNLKKTFGLTSEELADGRIATLEDIGLSPEYHTPLTRLIVQHVQTECAPMIQGYARALVLKGELTERDVRNRANCYSWCVRKVMGKFKDQCHPKVMAYQQALVNQDEDPAVRAQVLNAAEQRLKFCARPWSRPQPKQPGHSATWYFKEADGTVVTEEDDARKSGLVPA